MRGRLSYKPLSQVTLGQATAFLFWVFVLALQGTFVAGTLIGAWYMGMWWGIGATLFWLVVAFFAWADDT